MILRQLVHIILLCAAACATAGSSKSTVRFTELDIALELPPTITFRSQDASSGGNIKSGMQCVRLLFRTTKRYAGEICASKDQDLLRDKGVVPYESIPSYARTIEKPESGWVATSPMSLYPLLNFADSAFKTLAAVTDCDDSDGPIYRATASCHVAVSGLNSGTVLYSSFLLRDPAKNKAGVSIEEIQQMWTNLAKQ